MDEKKVLNAQMSIRSTMYIEWKCKFRVWIDVEDIYELNWRCEFLLAEIEQLMPEIFSKEKE